MKDKDLKNKLEETREKALKKFLEDGKNFFLPKPYLAPSECTIPTSYALAGATLIVTQLSESSLDDEEKQQELYHLVQMVALLSYKAGIERE